MCSQLYRARKPSEIPIIVPPPKRSPLTYPFEGTRYWSTSKISWFATTEAKHLLIGMTLVLLVGISLFLGSGLNPSSSPMIILTLSIILMASFLAHEMAHKFVAQNNGIRAEFRVTPFGALITFISIFAPFFKVIAPGAVMISGFASKKVIGIVAVVGPLTNVILGFGFIILSLLFSSSPISTIMNVGAYINGFLAMFNLIPLGIIDGKKVFTWSKSIWAITFLVSVALFIFSLVFL